MTAWIESARDAVQLYAAASWGAGLAVVRSQAIATCGKYALVAAGVGLGVAVVGTGMGKAGAAMKLKPIEAAGKLTFKAAETVLKIVLVPPISLALGVKYIVLTALPRTLEKTVDIIVRVVSFIANAISERIKRNSDRIRDTLLCFAEEIFLPSLHYCFDFSAWVLFDLVGDAIAACFEIVRLVGSTVSSASTAAGNIVYAVALRPLLKVLELVGRLVLKVAKWIGVNIVVPLVKQGARGAKWTGKNVFIPILDFLKSCGTAGAHGVAAVANKLLAAVAWTVDKLVNGIVWIIETGTAVAKSAWSNLIVPALEEIGKVVKTVVCFLVDRVIVPSVSAVARWCALFVQRIVVPLLQFIGKAVVEAANAIGKAVVWIVDNVLVRLLRAIGRAAVWLFETLIVPPVTVLVNTLVKICHSIAKAAVWFWDTIAVPAASAVWSLCVALARAVSSVITSIVTKTFVPIAVAVAHVISQVAAAMAKLVSSVAVYLASAVSNAVVGITNVVTTVVTQVVAIITATVAAVAKIFTG